MALNPHTPVSLLKDILTDLDLVLIMSVNPGFGGQKFIPRTLDKIAELKQMKMANHPNLIIEVDGGVNITNIATLVEAGADALVAGNAVFGDSNPSKMIADLKNIKIDSHQI
ncbi:Ribulose-phosphate 3-epimerase [compost metagenome]